MQDSSSRWRTASTAGLAALLLWGSACGQSVDSLDVSGSGGTSVGNDVNVEAGEGRATEDAGISTDTETGTRPSAPDASSTESDGRTRADGDPDPSLYTVGAGGGESTSSSFEARIRVGFGAASTATGQNYRLTLRPIAP